MTNKDGMENEENNHPVNDYFMPPYINPQQSKQIADKKGLQWVKTSEDNFPKFYTSVSWKYDGERVFVKPDKDNKGYFFITDQSGHCHHTNEIDGLEWLNEEADDKDEEIKRLREALETLNTAIEYAETEMNSNYAITTQDKELIKSALTYA